MRWLRRRQRIRPITPASRCIPDDVLLAYRDADLNGAEGATVSAHVRTCPTCEDRMAAMVRVARILCEGTPLPKAPSDRGRLTSAVKVVDDRSG